VIKRQTSQTALYSILSLVAIGLAGAFVSGQEGATSADSKPANVRPNGKGKNRPPLAITPEREAAALTFVERNHAELSALLAHLKSNQPKQYEQAVKEIYRVTERLAGIQERDPLLYELEVKHWTAQSHVQLLAARLKMEQTDEHRQQLREALSAQIAARLDVLKHQHEQAAERLAKMEKDIAQLEENRERTIERQLDVLTKPSTKTAAKQPGAKPIGKRAAERKKTAE
jgi:hypothetical protein